MPDRNNRCTQLVILLAVWVTSCLTFHNGAVAVRSAVPTPSDESSIDLAPYPSAAPTVFAQLTIIDGIVGRQPIYNVLVKSGIAPAEILSLTRSFKGLFDFRKSRPKDEYQLCLTPQKKLQKLTYKSGLTDQYVAIRTDDGDFHAFRREISLEKETVAKVFTIESSLYHAVTVQGENGGLVAAFVDIFAWDIDFYLYPRKGDTISVLFEKYSLDGQFIKYGKILAAQYIGSSRTFSAFYYEDQRTSGYYDENGVPLRKMFLRVPVKFGMCTSSYSVRRFHPISKKYKRHTGIDYGAPHGASIFATASGTIEFAGWQGGYGKLVVIRHPNGYKTYYGHCSRLLVKKGTYVEQGQTIARVGRTGRATGPHVHYEVRINGKPVNPNRLKSTKGSPLPSDQRAEFENIVQARLLLMKTHLYSKMPPHEAEAPMLKR